ncbi:A disintegrin and metalloproteinase with thrombospondin motifs 12 isoform X1 [Oncorhynchus mykiss]|uniref:ADAM metallopeptidase with thrombospondin type 1 motif, 12 n=1 Tax=Oncorhynchus mykiss TaxID=8022 RepID=A0A8C7SKM3_ONCMY|nr:A disintegrin and metalloproteinase with thrombospondin motifs 12 isoform X1 [Oncorhynchus mykiss]
MQCPRVSQVLSLLHSVLFLAASHAEFSLPGSLLSPDTESGRFLQSQSDVSVVHPVKIFRDGQFLSHSLVHRFKHGRHKRDLGLLEERVYYKVNFKGRDLVFNLTVNKYLVSNDYILERRNGSVNRTEHRTTGENACHLIGTVTDSTNARGTAAISTCEGLKGLLTLPEGPHFIEPVQGSTDGAVEGEGPEPHVVYPSITAATQRHKRSSEALDTPSPCGVKDAARDSLVVEREREDWAREQQEEDREKEEETAQHRSQRSVSRERWVETMVVADSELIEYHGSDNVESYVFTIMNMVAGIFHDASIGNAIHIILVRLILLQGEEKGLKIVHHADTSLASFCAWQKNLNPQSDTHPAHHDVAVLVTRKDICAGLNQPCETLGLSHLSGMCQPHRSCNINEDSGLPVAFTIAHELGHSFGIHHDGQGNDCEMEGRHPFIMSRQLMYDTSPLTWSYCSKDYITRFLDRGWGFCLDDRPSKKDLTTPLARLGIRYTTQHQCQLQYGPNATYCHEINNVCQILWCSVNGSCRSKLDSPIDGTRCGPEKWCISGECVIVGKLPETVNGNWGQWSSWSHCSRTCGAGVQSADRECNHPKPEFGGRYCTGERRRYRICNTKPCQKAKPTFREMLCSEFDTVPYQNELYEWVPVASPSSPCELHCRPVREHFSEKMLDAVTDGTPCFMNNNSRSICVNGVCKEVGCDYGIDSNALEDQCGVCLGDGSSCETVQMTFEGGDGFGYVDVGVIPEGARDIVVQEVEEAGNFLALRGQMSEEYFLNGQYIIQWNGEYKAGGATFYYERSGNLENLTSSGPTKQPVMIQLLYQEKNPGIKYEYTIKKTRQTGNEVIKSEYRWRHGAWTDCSTTCGLGEQQQPARCFELEVGVVDESLCDPESRPEDRHRKCKNMDCPVRWWVGGWQLCSATCGSEGVRKRTVMCVRTVAGEERVLHPGDCKQLLKPKPVVPCNRDLSCGPDWAVGSWSPCPVSCGGSVRSRTVTCLTAPKRKCDIETMPRSKSLCALLSCPSAGLRRRPGPPPKYRRVYPPKKHPTRQPVTHAWGPRSTSPTATPRTITVTERTTTPITTSTTRPLPPSSTASDITDVDGYELNLIVEKNGSVEDKKGFFITTIPTEEENRERDMRDKEEEEIKEEGSTSGFVFPDSGVRYTPGYDYVVEDVMTTGKEGHIDFDIFTTATSLRTPKQSPATVTTTRLHPTITPHTSVQTTSHTTPHATRVLRTTSPSAPQTGTGRQPVTPRHYPLTRPKTTPSTQRATTVPHTTPTPLAHTAGVRSTPKVPYHSKQVLYPTTEGTFHTRDAPYSTSPSTDAPHPTARIIKLKKPNEIPENGSSAPCSKKPGPLAKKPASRFKGPSLCSKGKGQKQKPEIPVVTFTNDYGSLNAQEPISMDVFWVVGNWSECSTSCGLGAVWRPVLCSSQQESDCANLERPEPARTCHLRPCATWLSGNWSKCPEQCEVVGRRQREVQCVDGQKGHPLRPFHCQALSSRPPSTLSCHPQPCQPWRTSPWGQCSRSCGGGLWERLVYCPEPQRCSATQRPNDTETCNLQRCSYWDPQDWEKCSVSCGGGMQHRVVPCVVEDSSSVENSLCDQSNRPDTIRTCNLQECNTNTGLLCRRNSMSSRFCDKLKLLGRCSLRSIQKQCCVTCRG